MDKLSGIHRKARCLIPEYWADLSTFGRTFCILFGIVLRLTGSIRVDVTILLLRASV